VRYPADVSPFAALPDDARDADWADLATLAGDEDLAVIGSEAAPSNSWTVTRRLDCLQMIGTDADAPADPEVIRLGGADITEMLDLTERTKPGPFASRTPELGSYYGIRRNGRLVAMAGERLRPSGWAEVSAVCTDPAFRGHGLAAKLVSTTVKEVRERGELPFLHVFDDNPTAIDLYARLGFTIRRKINITVLHPRSE
jgi:predicted GNAT family acetyltransferase